jgi:hypothetical protein
LPEAQQMADVAARDGGQAESQKEYLKNPVNPVKVRRKNLRWVFYFFFCAAGR